MNKALLIEKINQSEKGLDEREVVIKDVSYRWGYWGIMLVIATLILLRFIKRGHSNFESRLGGRGHSNFSSLHFFSQIALNLKPWVPHGGQYALNSLKTP